MKPTALRRATPKARSSASLLAHVAGELCRYDAHLRDVRGLAATTRKGASISVIRTPILKECDFQSPIAE